MQDAPASPLDAIRNSPLLRILLIGFLIGLLQVPVAMIDGLIAERQSTKDQAVDEVAGKWGRAQSVIGPRVVVPFLTHESVISQDGKTTVRTVQRLGHFLPAELQVEGRIHGEIRARGIFEVPVYRMSLRIEGRFERPDLSDWLVAPEDILWDRAQLAVAIADARAIQEPTALQWNGAPIEFAAGTGDFFSGESGIHASLKGHLTEKSFQFSFPLELNGSLRAFFAPLGDQSTIGLESDWQDPSFQGNWLPTTREVTAKGFTATWKIPALGRNYPSRWMDDGGAVEQAVSASQVGVDFLKPVDPYRMADRSVKYEILFLGLTFLALWLFEVVARLRVHPVQYLLVGAAIALFYLLELSLSEQLGFMAAYLIASSAVVALVSGYAIAVLRGFRRAALLGAGIGVLYGYLYLLLMSEDYALLVGSIGLFLVLGLVMALTQRIDWYAPQRRAD
jgi:inner membrane protein